MIRTYVAAVALAATWVTIAAGCASDTAAPGLSADEVRSSLGATCGAVSFSSIPPDVEEFPSLDSNAQDALDELVNGPTGVEAAGFDTEYRWSIAARTDDLLVLFGQGGSPDTPLWADVQFARESGAWMPIAWGGCEIIVQAAGFGPASVAFDPERPIDPASTELSLAIREQNCASGQAPEDRPIVPSIVETEQSVTLIVLVESVTGNAECPDNPWYPINVTLERPLGPRQLLDGHTFPAEPVGPLGELRG